MKRLVFFIFLFVISIITYAKNIIIPELQGRVNDYTNTLCIYEIGYLNSLISDFETQTDSQFVVLIMPTTGDATIEEYSMAVAKEWKIGRSDFDDGVILLIAKDYRELRIEVGYGLESVITDEIEE